MIRLFGKNDTVFNESLGDITIQAIKCKINKGIWQNKEYYCDITVPTKYNDVFVEGRIIAVDTPWGIQGFRIGNVQKKSNSIYTRAFHISYDSEGYILEDVYPQNLSASAALQWVINHADENTPFSTESDITSMNSARFVMKTLFYAICNIASTWKGNIDVDNYHIVCNSTIGKDRGATFKYGQNITGVEVKENWNDVVTTLYPVGYNGIKIDPLISEIKYDRPYKKIVEFYPSQDIDISDEEAVRSDLIQQSIEYLNINQYPKVSYDISTYVKDAVDIGDTIEVDYEKLSIKIYAQVTQVVYNALTGKIDQTSFGNYHESIKNVFTEIQTQMNLNKEHLITRFTELQKAMEESKSLINKYLYEGHRYETKNATYFLNALPVENATKFMIVSLGGIGFGTKEVGQDITEASYDTAWTIDGKFNGKFIAANSIKSNQVDVNDLFAQEIHATGKIIGAHIETESGKIGPFTMSDNGTLVSDVNGNNSELDYLLRIGYNKTEPYDDHKGIVGTHIIDAMNLLKTKGFYAENQVHSVGEHGTCVVGQFNKQNYNVINTQTNISADAIDITKTFKYADDVVDFFTKKITTNSITELGSIKAAIEFYTEQIVSTMYFICRFNFDRVIMPTLIADQVITLKGVNLDTLNSNLSNRGYSKTIAQNIPQNTTKTVTVENLKNFKYILARIVTNGGAVPITVPTELALYDKLEYANSFHSTSGNLISISIKALSNTQLQVWGNCTGYSFTKIEVFGVY